MKPKDPVTPNRTVILLVAIAVEGFLSGIAHVLGALLDVSPTGRLAGAGWNSVALGVAASLPPALAILLSLHLRADFAWRLLHEAEESIRTLLILAPWQLAIVAFFAGLCEEALFRGVIQTWTSLSMTASLGSGWAHVCGIGVGAILFGLAHPITRVYVMVATLFGIWMGLLLVMTQNLAPAMVAHAAYDFIIMIYLKYTWGPRDSSSLP